MGRHRKNIGSMEKKVQAINFSKITLDRLKDKCKREGTNMSTYVDYLVSKNVMGDVEFHKELARMHYTKFLEHNMFAEMAEDRKKTKNQIKIEKAAVMAVEDEG